MFVICMFYRNLLTDIPQLENEYIGRTRTWTLWPNNYETYADYIDKLPTYVHVADNYESRDNIHKITLTFDCMYITKINDITGEDSLRYKNLLYGVLINREYVNKINRIVLLGNHSRITIISKDVIIRASSIFYGDYVLCHFSYLPINISSAFTLHEIVVYSDALTDVVDIDNVYDNVFAMTRVVDDRRYLCLSPQTLPTIISPICIGSGVMCPLRLFFDDDDYFLNKDPLLGEKMTTYLTELDMLLNNKDIQT